MKYCQYCGSEMKLEDRYCQNCGADSQVPVAQVADSATDSSIAQEAVSSTQDTEKTQDDVSPDTHLSKDKLPETAVIYQDSEEEIQVVSPVTQNSEGISESETTAQETKAPSQEATAGTTQIASSPFAQAAAPKMLNPNGIETKFNWGAFVSPFSFGIAHRAYLGLLSLLIIIPILGWIFAIVWAFVFGFNGEKWALENPVNQYRDNEEFRKAMSPWHRYGLVAFIIAAAVIVIYIIILIMIMSSFSHYDNYNY
ncbi:hypothetical protein FACS1894192_10400 [Bacilli bacterium]|nr:hypothetical protein FACS1894192_10400 [Bacilli bacterium]